MIANIKEIVASVKHRGAHDAALPGRARDEPRERARPGERAPEALEQTGDPERRGVSGEPEAEARHGHENEPREHGLLGPEARGGDSPRQRAEESSRRIRGDGQRLVAEHPASSGALERSAPLAAAASNTAR
jgi:hypothetical protein